METTPLARRRIALGLSRAQLAQEVGVSPVTIWRWETGAFEPSWLAQRELDATLWRLERDALLAQEATS